MLRGHVEPRLSTPSLRELTPATSYGFAVVDFARDVLSLPLDPWQEWLVIHAGELLPDGRPRFKKLLVIVARQSGKTHLLKVLTLFWLFVEQWPMVLGQSTSLATAKESWDGAYEIAVDNPWLYAEIGNRRLDNNDPHWKVASGAKYRIAAANRKGARGLSLDRLIVDEVREHRDWVAYNAAMPTLNARPESQAWLISNQGDEQSVVLDSLRDAGIAGLDESLGLFEWSAKDGMAMTDPEAICMANPNVGRRQSLQSIMNDARRAEAGGGLEATGFRTEILCQRVRALDAAIDPVQWAAGLLDGRLSDLRDNLSLCLDVSPDMQHVSLVGAASMPDGRLRVEVVKVWEGQRAIVEVKRDLSALLTRVKPRAFGWLPGGPAASLAAQLKERKGRTSWPPPGVAAVEVAGEVSAACMGFAAMVSGGQVVHSGEPLLDMHVTGAEKLHNGDVWRFSRKGQGHCDAAYAAAGALQLAQSLPKPQGKPRLIIAG